MLILDLLFLHAYVFCVYHLLLGELVLEQEQEQEQELALALMN
jgi:hypothetical protein